MDIWKLNEISYHDHVHLSTHKQGTLLKKTVLDAGKIELNPNFFISPVAQVSISTGTLQVNLMIPVPMTEYTYDVLQW